MNLGFFDGFPSLTRMLRSRFYQADAAGTGAVSGQVNNYQTLEVDAQEVQNCGLHIQLKGTGPLIATSVSDFVQSQTTAPILAGNARGASSTDLQRIRSAATQVASGTASAIGGGAANTASGAQSAIAGGADNTANGTYSFCPGGRFALVNGRASGWAYGTQGSAAVGRQQCSGQGQVATTTNATATPTTDNNTPGTLTINNIFTLQNNSAVMMNCRILARDTAAANANDVRAWDVEVVARRGANAAATTVDFSNIVSVFNTAGAAAWTVATATDTTNGGFYFNVTGEAGKTIRWMVKIDGVEVA